MRDSFPLRVWSAWSFPLGLLLLACSGTAQAAEAPQASAADVAAEVPQVSAADVAALDMSHLNLSTLKNIDPLWVPSHARHSAEIASLQRADVIFVGDSLTEGWVETSRGLHFSLFDGSKVVFREMQHQVGVGFLNFGYGGDRLENMRWRIEHGEMPTSVSVRLVVLCGGANNLIVDKEPQDLVALKVLSLAKYIQTVHPEAHLLLLGLMPESYLKDSLSPDLRTASVNSIIKASVDGVLTSNATFLDCSSFFITADGLRIPEYYQKDNIHFRAKGYKAWAQCITPVLSSMLRTVNP